MTGATAMPRKVTKMAYGKLIVVYTGMQPMQNKPGCIKFWFFQYVVLGNFVLKFDGLIKSCRVLEFVRIHNQFHEVIAMVQLHN